MKNSGAQTRMTISQLVTLACLWEGDSPLSVYCSVPDGLTTASLRGTLSAMFSGAPVRNRT